jgi:hypothetical protein
VARETLRAFEEMSAATPGEATLSSIRNRDTQLRVSAMIRRENACLTPDHMHFGQVKQIHDEGSSLSIAKKA